ncbi:MAG: hypothetical protein J3K34DRAFT_520636 [Monoraphidium minutum]|nr:MAG: hypothetical protein J3K34DRAFT_520636 [Monoraphidium minutum]
MAETDDYAKRTARIKNLLSSYYGDASQPATPGAAGDRSPSAAPGSPKAPPTAAMPPPRGGARGGGGGGLALSMDSAAFDAERHIQQMLRGLPLERLLAEHRGMAREIKNLDSDMQQLVYENYNKFITATDTIKVMKSNVDGMEGDMDKLKGIMDDVAEKSAAVNSKLQRRRQQCEELRRVDDLLTRLQARAAGAEGEWHAEAWGSVFDLPRRMRAALEEGALDSAVEFYADAQPILQKYGHRGALAAAKAGAEAAARDAGAELKRRLAERRDDAERAVLLLRRLGEGDESLQDKYLQGRLERMRRILSEAAAAADGTAAAAAAPPGAPLALAGPLAGPSPAAAAAREAWGFGEGGGAPGLGSFVKALDERLLSALQETVANVSGIFLQDDRSAARRKPLVKVAKDVATEYFRVIRRAVDEYSKASVAAAARLSDAEAAAAGGAAAAFDPAGPGLKFAAEWGADAVAQAMEAVTADTGRLAGALPELGLRDWAAAASEQALRGHVTAALGALERRAALAVGALAGDDAGEVPLAAAFACTSEAIQRCTMAMLQGLRAYQQRHGRLVSSVLPQLGDVVAGQMQALLAGLLASFMAAARVRDNAAAIPREGPASLDAAGGHAKAGSGGGGAAGGSGGGAAGGSGGGTAGQEPPNSGLLLLLAKLCLFLESITVPAVMEELALNFPGQPGDPDHPPPFVAGEVARRMGTAAQLLLAAYVEAHGRGLAREVEAATGGADWLRMEEPSAPRPMCDALLARLAAVEAEVLQLVEATGRAAGAGGSHHRGASGSVSDRDPGFALGSGAVERGVAKLFRSKAKITGSAALLGAVAASGLKSLVECVRLQTLGRAALRQLQLDMCYLRPRLLRLAGGGGNGGGGGGGGGAGDAVAQLVDEVVAAGAERCLEPGGLLEPAALERALQAAGRGGAAKASRVVQQQQQQQQQQQRQQQQWLPAMRGPSAAEQARLDAVGHPSVLALILERLPRVVQLVTVCRLSRAWRAWAASRADAPPRDLSPELQETDPVPLAAQHLPPWFLREAWVSLPAHCSRERVLMHAAWHGDVATLAWARREGGARHYWSAAVTSAAAAGGSLAALQWLRALRPPCPWEAGAASDAAFGGHLHVLQWMQAQEPPCPWNPSYCYCMAWFNAHTETAAWIDTQR